MYGLVTKDWKRRTMNDTLGELLNLFEDDEQFQAQKSENIIHDEDSKEIKKMENKQKKEMLDLHMSNANGADKKRRYKIKKTDINDRLINDK
ncbi:unnamed protein product [Onchocerca flexuosa]|uniref:Uncharacterized protein n=1 Tax=Onchocerca flexuosa TaxID=387005 RepID=A0A183HSW8_9BILA|nr:unnamed protein product [Onchocerca flexuosa]